MLWEQQCCYSAPAVDFELAICWVLNFTSCEDITRIHLRERRNKHPDVERLYINIPLYQQRVSYLRSIHKLETKVLFEIIKLRGKYNLKPHVWFWLLRPIRATIFASRVRLTLVCEEYILRYVITNEFPSLVVFQLVEIILYFLKKNNTSRVIIWRGNNLRSTHSFILIVFESLNYI